jgi:hypothetical protein
VITHQVKEGDGDFVTKHVFAISAERHAEMEEMRAACTDDDESTECERPKRVRHMRGPGPRAGGDDEVELAPDPAFFEEAA